MFLYLWQGHVWDQKVKVMCGIRWTPVEHSLPPLCMQTSSRTPSLGKCVALVGDVVVWLRGTGLCERYEPFHE